MCLCDNCLVVEPALPNCSVHFRNCKQDSVSHRVDAHQQRRSAAHFSTLIRVLPAVRLTHCLLVSVSSRITLSTSQLLLESCETRPAFPLHPRAAKWTTSLLAPFENNPPTFLPTLDPLQLQFTCIRSHLEVKGQGLQDKQGANICACNSDQTRQRHSLFKSQRNLENCC